MENVLTAIIVIFVILFAVLTLSHTFIATQETLSETRLDLEDRLIERTGTQIMPVDGQILSGGADIDLRLRNSGSTRLTDYENWDVIVQYYESETDYHVEWLPYAGSSPTNNEWTVDSIYSSGDQPEVYENSIFNPGEEMVLHLNVTPAIGPGMAVYVTTATSTGISTGMTFTRNAMPVLMVNQSLTVGSMGSGTINTALLQTTDPDNSADELTYQITVAPAQGTLSLNTTFTQSDIDTGLLSYTHTGTGSDSFTFVVSDGEYEIGEYVYEIVVNAAPQLAANVALPVAPGGTYIIDANYLQTTDADTTPSNLIYTVTTAPAQGTLSPGYSFTQEDINNNMLSYTHSGSGSDTFQFTVSDGYTTIGAYSFTITSS